MATEDDFMDRVYEQVCAGQHPLGCAQCSLYIYIKSMPDEPRLVCGGGRCTGRCRNTKECNAVNDYIAMKTRQIKQIKARMGA